MLTAFFLGLCIDIFSDTLAIHSASLITIVFLRPFIMRFVFGVNYEFQSFKISNATKAQQITFLALLIIIHHVIFFTLEIFSISNLAVIIKKIIFTFCATLVICLLLISLFSTEKE